MNKFGEPAAWQHAAIYTDAVVDLLLDGGLEKATMGSVARHLRQAPSAVTQMTHGRRGFWSSVVGRFSGRWVRWVAQPEFRGGVKIKVPESADEVHAVRVWSALKEVAAGQARSGDGALAELVAEAESYERKMIVAALQGRGIEVTEPVVTALACLGAGLREAVAAPVAPLAPEEAREVATLVTRTLCGEAALATSPTGAASAT